MSPRRHSEQNSFVVDFSQAMILLSRRFIHTANWLAVWQDKTASCHAFNSTVSVSLSFGSSFFNGRRPIEIIQALIEYSNIIIRDFLPGPGGFIVSLNGGLRNFRSRIASTFMIQLIALYSGRIAAISPPTIG